jgi:hypothetical protein
MNELRRTHWLGALIVITGWTTYAVADGPGMHRGMKMGMGMHECPMPGMQEGLLADAKAENTANGAVIRLIAKDPKNPKPVQELAQRMAEHLKSGCQHDQAPGAKPKP